MRKLSSLILIILLCNMIICGCKKIADDKIVTPSFTTGMTFKINNKIYISKQLTIFADYFGTNVTYYWSNNVATTDFPQLNFQTFSIGIGNHSIDAPGGFFFNSAQHIITRNELNITDSTTIDSVTYIKGNFNFSCSGNGNIEITDGQFNTSFHQ